MANEITGEKFDEQVVQSERPVLVDFWGPLCGPCLAMMPAVEELERKYADKIKLVKIDASRNKRFCLTLKVLGLPTYLFYKDGKEVGRLTGEHAAIDNIEATLKKMIG